MKDLVTKLLIVGAIAFLGWKGLALLDNSGMTRDATRNTDAEEMLER
ncbi:MAG TPA: hypothetical protein PKM88_07385 [bacterium]|nr:hypothetical protein [bacterium]